MSKHTPRRMNKKVRRSVFECVADDDMPDGAYFAMAQEFGLEPEDLVDEQTIVKAEGVR